MANLNKIASVFIVFAMLSGFGACAQHDSKELNITGTFEGEGSEGL